ncbi:Helix-turn-helix type 11 domain protein [Thermobaculum terrenum ATCC BAA-798]|uniref:Helix-turn-helix type 11 domain protein n=1 Tax=Thermobaculum terrenum (strain ATCC BAA-798 / CCMEE 7001 / YNP1) TaxID=525904 RepID=D1CEW4_THET1|nr:transcriptional regulator [Thermobaculum terrenum]ACZ41470.1 Helix-turn-helix type 11 domain protein [Thermobaculum terrenum ATCC BAA-798]
MSRLVKLGRLQRIERILYQNPQGLTIQRLAELCDVSIRTIYRDIKDLEQIFEVPLTRENGRWKVVRTSYLPPVRFSLHEAMGLFLSYRLALRYMDKQNPDLEEAWSKIGSVMPEPISRFFPETLREIKNKPLDREYNRTVRTLTSAWAEGRRVRIQYLSSRRSTPKERLIEPYFMQPSGISHALYVIARDVEIDEIRTFKVQRIKDIELTDEKYEIPGDFDALEFLKNSWTIWSDEPVEVKVRFSPRVASAVKEAIWHPTQELKEEPDGSVIWTGRVSGILEISAWIRSWGAEAEVLEPKSLRESLVNDVQSLAKLYGLGLTESASKQEGQCTVEIQDTKNFAHETS